MGLYQAWPRAGEWRRTLWPYSRGPAAAAQVYPWYRAYQWHRAIGLLIALPALLLVLAGIVRAFDDPLGTSFEAGPPSSGSHLEATPIPTSSAHCGLRHFHRTGRCIRARASQESSIRTRSHIGSRYE